MLFKKHPQGNSRFAYPLTNNVETSRLVEKLATMPPHHAANAIADALAQVIARGAWPAQTAENMANLISRAVDDIARGRGQ